MSAPLVVPRTPLARGLVLAVLAALPFIALATLRELWALPRFAGLVSGVLACALLLTLMVALYRDRARIGRVGWSFIAVAAVLGLACGAAAVEHQVVSAESGTYLLSDGTQKPAGAPGMLEAWGRRLPGYALHPAYPQKIVPHAIEVKFAGAPNEVKASFSKEESSLLLPDGKPTGGDGVRIRATVVQADGSVLPEQVIDLSQQAFLAQRWIPHVFQSDGGIATLRLAVEGGPPGSTTFYDATLIGLKASLWQARAAKVGKAVLAGIGFATFAWWLVTVFRAGSRGEGSVVRDLGRGWLPLALVVATILLVGGWPIVSSETVYFWDARNYWQKTEVLHALLAGGEWREFVSTVAAAYSHDYSMIPAILPAAVATLMPAGPTRIVYGMTLLVAYAVPAYIAIAWAGSRFVPSQGASAPAPTAWILAALAVFVAMPVSFNRTLLLMPDIGGIVLVVIAWWAAATMIRACVDEQASRELVRASAMLGITCAAMFVFRRWYVFAAVGLGCMTALLLLAELARTHGRRLDIVRRTAWAGVLVAASAFPLVCWVVFDWSSSAASHDYANLYSSYRNALSRDVSIFLGQFGVAAPLLAVVGLALAWPTTRGDLRRRWWLLVGGALIAFLAFLRVQSPGPQHYNLVVPCLGAAVAVVALRLAARFGLRALMAFVLCIAAGNIIATRLPSDASWRIVFPGYDAWLPRRMPSMAGYQSIGAWLGAPERNQKTVCMVASSSPINSGVLSELWQVVPALSQEALARRVLQLPAVDSRDGPPRALDQCDLALVGDPFQSHLAPHQQDNVAIVREGLMSGRGFGAAFVARKEFRMDGGVRLIAYERVREVTAAEIEDLQRRWTQGEAEQR